MANKTLVICYTDKMMNTSHFVKTEDSLEEWKNKHHNFPYVINHVFYEKWDIKDNASDRELAFLNNCTAYGLNATDLHKRFMSRNGHEIELLGMNPSNRKYKFIIYDYNDNKQYKVSKSYMDATQEIA